jgi:hypothetical protein
MSILPCVASGGVSSPHRVFKDSCNMTSKITLKEAFEIKRLLHSKVHMPPCERSSQRVSSTK